MAFPKDDKNQISTTIDHQESIIPSEEETITVSPESYFDVPPVSFWVPKSDEADWFDRYAMVERINSKKFTFYGNSNHQPKPFPQHQQQQRISSSSSSSKTKASFIGLPMAQKSYFRDVHHWQNKAGTVYLYRNRPEHGGNSATKSIEPASPQVSCLGMIETKKERTKNLSELVSSQFSCKGMIETKKEGTKKPGLWRSISAILRTGFKSNTAVSEESTESIEPDTRKPVLAGLNRIKSKKGQAPLETINHSRLVHRLRP